MVLVQARRLKDSMLGSGQLVNNTPLTEQQRTALRQMCPLALAWTVWRMISSCGSLGARTARQGSKGCVFSSERQRWRRLERQRRLRQGASPAPACCGLPHPGGSASHPSSARPWELAVGRP